MKKEIPRVVNIEGITYKLNRVIPYDEYDNHHIISKKERARFKVGEKDNIIRIQRRTHVALNNLFENNQEPKKQLKIMFDIWKTALSVGVRNELYMLLSLPDDVFYNESLLNGKHKKKLGTEG